MSVFEINGGRRLKGSIAVQGSKNSVLPILSAAYLAAGESVIHNCPRISDVDTTLSILAMFGCRVRREGNTVVIDSTDVHGNEIPRELMCGIRSSVLFLGPVAARMKNAVIFSPGGCRIGQRPIDLHIRAMQLLGCSVSENDGMLEFFAPDGLAGAKIELAFPSVGATENAILASCTAEGETVIENAAREPEIEDLCRFLNKCGADIRGAGESTVIINGVKSLHGAEHSVIPDRIAAATYLACAAAAGGDVALKSTAPEQLCSVLEVFEKTGCSIRIKCDELRIRAPQRLRPVRYTATEPYPGFPTDVQAQLMAAMCLADGESSICESIFEDRFGHVSQLEKMGADIRITGNTAAVHGVSELTGARVAATDLRCGSALVIAGLAAHGISTVEGICHIDRGYESLENGLSLLNADIKRREQ